MIVHGSTVSIHYTLTLEDGTTAESSVGGEPLTYTHGAGQLLPRLEEALEGRAEGDELRVELSPADGYGEPQEAALQEFDLERVPEDSRAVGTLLLASDPEGNSQQVRVAEVREDTVILDFNHPLAGERLTFDLEVVAVETGGGPAADDGSEPREES
ncbi:MAG: peptidylprolyl isomerase [Thermoanaerobaculia bacterium]|nr:peptidylprolyl isomerase [Thermoanaerobaculia bacterium]